MKIGVPAETFPGEQRVALIPDALPMVVKAGHEILVEPGAGSKAGFSDDSYREKGATIAADRAEVFEKSDVICQVLGYGANKDAGKPDLELLKPGQSIIAMFDPLSEPKCVQELASRNVLAFSLELMPRITRAQSMDVLSSMATVAGYKAVLIAADHAPRMFPMLMTAAGTVTPAHVFIIGAGVAGLQAISVAKRLGAVVKAYDVRPAVKEQIESLGAKFVEMDLQSGDAEDKGGYAKEMGEEFIRKQRELMTSVLADSHVAVTTAAIPGRKAPILITAQMVDSMRPGSVIVDLAAERGGNCELTKVDEVVEKNGVTILGPSNLPSKIPFHSSQLFAKNVTTFIKELTDDKGALTLDMENEVHRGTLLTREGEVVHEQIRKILDLPVLNSDSKETAAAPKAN